MKPATISEIKRELKHLSQQELMDLCLRLARSKKDNKELLTYLLFEADDEATYVADIKQEVDQDFSEMNTRTTYYAKKSVQKIVRKLTKYMRYSGKPETKVELLIHFLEAFDASPVRIHSSRVLMNIYNRQLDAIDKALKSMHEDLQYDFQERRNALKRKGRI